MKKYLGIAGYVVLYLAIVFAFSLALNNLWWSAVPKNFANKNYDLVTLIAFILTLAVFALIFKLRKMSLIATCNFAKLSVKGFTRILITGILMGVFTCCVCNTSLVIKKLPIFEEFLNFQIGGISNFIIFLLVVGVMFACEEIIFRGTIFNEIRRGFSLYAAIIIATAVYGLLNGFEMGLAVGIYASVAALFYNLAYVYAGSLFASITLQVASIYVIAICMKTGLWKQLRGLGDPVLVTSVVVIMLVILTLYYFIYRDYKKSRSGAGTSVSA